MKQTVRQRKSHKQRREQLQNIYDAAQQQLEQERRLLAQRRLREQVLTDMCLLLDSIAHARISHPQPHQLLTAEPQQQEHIGLHISPNPDQHQHQQQGPQCSRPPAEPNLQTNNSSSSSRQRVDSAVQAIPTWCCTADLLSKATAERVEQVLALTAADISTLLTDTFHQLLALLEFVNRGQAPAAAQGPSPAPAPAQQQTQGWGIPASTPGSSSSGLDSSPSSSTPSAGSTDRTCPAHAHGMQQQHVQLSTQQAAGHVLGLPPAPAAASAWQDEQQHQQDHPKRQQQTRQQQQQQQEQEQHLSELQDVVQRFFGIVTLIMVLQPLPLVRALCLNHRTQQQGAAPKEHWLEVTRRLRLTQQQRDYLTLAHMEVRHRRGGHVGQLSGLAQEVASPSLLVQAAQSLTGQQQQQHDPQDDRLPAATETRPPPAATGAVTAAGGSGGGDGKARGSGTAAGVRTAAAAAKGLGSELLGSSGVSLSSRLEHTLTYTSLVALLVLDRLTVVQKAHWIVSAYPWVPGAVLLCSCIEELGGQYHMQQQQQPGDAGGRQHCASGAAPLLFSQQHYLAGEQHLQRRRQLWWWQQLSFKDALPAAAAAGAAAGVGPAAVPRAPAAAAAAAGPAQLQDCPCGTDAVMVDSDHHASEAGAAAAAAVGAVLLQPPAAAAAGSSGCCACLYGRAGLEAEADWGVRRQESM